MKKFFLCLLFALTVSFDSQQKGAYDAGEWIKLRIHYGFVNAGYATLEVRDATFNGKKTFHVIGRGYTTGIPRFFFKVDDLYESYIDKDTQNPYQYVRKINEGGYTKNQEGFYVFFNSAKNIILLKY
jgi:hypothetical protein